MKLNFSAWNFSKDRSTQTEKIAFLHGLGGSGKLWRPIAAALEKDFAILAPDQRGHGGSTAIPANEPGFAPLRFGKDVLDTLEAENFHPTYLVGHSMGVRTATATAFLRPEWIKGLVLIDLGLAGGAGGGWNERLSEFLAILPKSFPSRDLARSFMNAHSPDKAMVQYLMAVATQTASGELTFPFDHQALIATLQEARSADVRDWIKAYATTARPILLLRGGSSKVWTEREFEAERRHFRALPNVRFETVPGAGHGLPFEKKPELLALLRDFIQP